MADRFAGKRADVLIVLSSLRAEGTPRLALDLCRNWLAQDVSVLALDLERGPAELRPDFETLGVPVVQHAVGHVGYRRYFSLALAVYRLCRCHRPQAMVCMPFGLHSLVALGARLAGVRYCCAHVGNPPGVEGMSPMAVRKARWLVHLGRVFTHRLVCCSAYVQAQTVKQMRVPVRDTCVIYNGVYLEAFRRQAEARYRVKPADRAWQLGMVATLEGHKDQATLIRAAALLRDRGYELAVRLIGDGARRQELVDLTKDLEAPVHLMGSLSDVPAQVAELDVFVFATTEQEGLGIALIEAMAAGVPVVASDVAACREVLDDGELGLLAPPHDAQALTDSIAAALVNWDATQARAAKAYDKAVNTFSAEAMATQYLEVLGLEGKKCAMKPDKQRTTP